MFLKQKQKQQNRKEYRRALSRHNVFKTKKNKKEILTTSPTGSPKTK